MKNHLTKLSFCGLRRLNPFLARSPDLLREWHEQRTWYALGTVNIFIGVNGAGKSTVLELIDVLRAPQRIASLARENQTSNSLTIFDLCFEQGEQFVGIITSNRQEAFTDASNIDLISGSLNIQCLQLFLLAPAGSRVILERNISKLELDPDSIARISEGVQGLSSPVMYYDPAIPISPAQLVSELNAAREYLRGILSPAEVTDPFALLPPFHADDDPASRVSAQPFYLLEGNRIGIYLSDDCRQHNHVQIPAIPAGWRHLAALLAWLRTCSRGAICLIEEPETHLHPRLQRYLARATAKIAVERDLQLFIATHSPVFQQPSVWPQGANVFEARADGLSRLDGTWRLLDELGIKGADVSQSNGVIWVEGPSDRIYIKHWLALHCGQHGLPPPMENRDYAFCFYGGASLSHFTPAEQGAFIEMLSINRNMVIVIDRDSDFSLSPDGDLECTNAASAKRRVIDDLKKLNSSSSLVWVTDEYTIESYLPPPFRAKYFDQTGHRLVLKPGQRKVHIARKYIETHTEWSNCCDSGIPLHSHVAALYALISRWDL